MSDAYSEDILIGLVHVNLDRNTGMADKIVSWRLKILSQG